MFTRTYRPILELDKALLMHEVDVCGMQKDARE